MASKKVLEYKKKYVEELAQKIKDSNMGIIISYKGINVEQDTKLRKEIRDASLEYFVVKNSMLGFATKEVGYDFEEHLHGETAIALSKDDPILISKIITKYVKDLKETAKFFIKTGFLEGRVVSAELISEIGSLPTKEDLISKLLALLTAPMRRFAVVVSAISDKRQKEGES